MLLRILKLQVFSFLLFLKDCLFLAGQFEQNLKSEICSSRTVAPFPLRLFRKVKVTFWKFCRCFHWTMRSKDNRKFIKSCVCSLLTMLLIFSSLLLDKNTNVYFPSSNQKARFPLEANWSRDPVCQIHWCANETFTIYLNMDLSEKKKLRQLQNVLATFKCFVQVEMLPSSVFNRDASSEREKASDHCGWKHLRDRICSPHMSKINQWLNKSRSLYERAAIGTLLQALFWTHWDVGVTDATQSSPIATFCFSTLKKSPCVCFFSYKVFKKIVTTVLLY